MLKADLKAALIAAIGPGTSETLAEAMILAAITPIDPEPVAAVGAATAEGSRDETADSIDPATGTLTDDAVAKRAAKRVVDQAEEDVSAAELKVAEAEETADEAEVAAANEKLDGAKQRLTVAQTRKEAADGALAEDDAAGGAEEGGIVGLDPALGDATTAADLTA